MSYEDILDEEPQSREEAYLKYIAENMDDIEPLPPVTEEDDGKVLTVENGKWAPGNPPEGGVTDVLCNGKSVVKNGVATVPNGSGSVKGLVAGESAYGISLVNGTIKVVGISDSDIAARNSFTRGITPGSIDKIVKAALCDGKGAAWTEAEKQAAKNRMGIQESGGSIPTITLTIDQIISMDPMLLQLSEEQYDILLNNHVVTIDATEFGFNAFVALKVYSDEDESQFHFWSANYGPSSLGIAWIYSEDEPGVIGMGSVDVDTILDNVIYNSFVYNPAFFNYISVDGVHLSAADIEKLHNIQSSEGVNF